MKVPYCRIACDGNELAYVREVLASGWLTTGAKALELERRFAEAVQAGHAIAVNSCTSALHLALEALGVKAGDEVFVPTMTFTASAEVIRYMNAHPVFLDVEYGTSLLTPGIVREAIREHPGVKTLVVVHYGGQAAPLFGRGGEQGILEICRQHGIRVVEDAAHAFPTKLGEAMVGSIGDVTCFSFYANKTITTGEGGMLTTNDAAIAARARTMRLHGIDRVVWDRFTSAKPGWEYDVVAPGFKYNMPDINAAIGLAQLERAWDFQRERLRCAKRYLRDLAERAPSRSARFPRPGRGPGLASVPRRSQARSACRPRPMRRAIGGEGDRDVGPLPASPPHELLSGHLSSEARGFSPSRADLERLFFSSDLPDAGR